MAAANEDTALVEQLLKQGADANGTAQGRSSLWWCKRLSEAELLVRYHANVAQQHEQNDLIEPICTTLHNDQRGIELMEFYLQSGVQLNEKNNFGYWWIKRLLNDLHTLDRVRVPVEEKIRVLWRFGRHNTRSLSAMTKFVQGWKSYPVICELSQGCIIDRLHQRSLTGRHFTKIKPIVMKHRAAK